MKFWKKKSSCDNRKKELHHENGMTRHCHPHRSRLGFPLKSESSMHQYVSRNEMKIEDKNKIKVEEADLIKTKENPCGVCLEYSRTHAFQCGHTCCHACAKALIEKKKNCPICRQEITTVIKLYLS